MHVAESKKRSRKYQKVNEARAINQHHLGSPKTLSDL